MKTIMVFERDKSVNDRYVSVYKKHVILKFSVYVHAELSSIQGYLIPYR